MQRVIMAMSGGVDSSVAAALLLEAGYEVIGMTMQIWQTDLPYDLEAEGGCCSLGAVEDARSVANKLGIPYYVVNMQAPFREKVIDYFVAEYLEGRTPNPCIICNQELKFNNLLDKAKALDGKYVATGHYVRREQDPSTGRWILRKGLDLTKDQSYALYGLTQAQLESSLFPLGGHTKTSIRQKAAELGLRVADKPDSQEICFVPDQDYRRFIDEYRPGAVRPGKIVDKTGKVLGEHSGIINYTIGQRKGLGIASSVPLFVTEIRPETNEIVVGLADEVFADRLVAEALNWIAIPALQDELRVEAKIRYAAPPAPAVVRPLPEGRVEVLFDMPQRAITPGQSVVFYQGDLVVGGGVIAGTDGS
ncbi:tRNA (5-methylaminomethyl-2-thiouridylate)-methyltransferase [Hydrogenispora ethanolica]|uniref:tRNA-specific 2-thiouridylase MnmA n=1 Tax=Hydrogenispora ethanolica TaxID=1082276 RepID=A0A4V2QEU1_HYDET|nr:tRNA 2-thiouridine(34) synthase MnmA [Hydrogenispora ethanolica]TCL69367.1 tRNA (5-methylaminomethyl-2-thiouridylate)-methyltransferase [Hydrogenispora ethanolica]